MKALILTILVVMFAVPQFGVAAPPPPAPPVGSIDGFVCGPNHARHCSVPTITYVQASPYDALCYSVFQTDPGFWPPDEAKVLMAEGYWPPYAETTVPTNTVLATGVYLNCNGFTATNNWYGGDGTNLGPVGWPAGLAGYYPEGK